MTYTENPSVITIPKTISKKDVFEFIDIINACAPIQSNLNDLTVPDWKIKNLPFNRAFAKELGELQDMLGWKWWKATPEFSIKQAFLEVVDCFHFFLSMAILTGSLVADIRYYCQTTRSQDTSVTINSNNVDYNDYIDDLVAQLLTYSPLDGWSSLNAYIALAVLTKALGFELKDLQNWYMGKNALNIFRQNNGYQYGTYIKEWDRGLEDNVFLEQIIDSSEGNLTLDQIYAKLDEKYKELTQ